jgi:hypothetical protein
VDSFLSVAFEMKPAFTMQILSCAAVGAYYEHHGLVCS